MHNITTYFGPTRPTETALPSATIQPNSSEDQRVREIYIMSEMEHFNVVKFIGICMDSDLCKLYIGMELMHSSTVFEICTAREFSNN